MPSGTVGQLARAVAASVSTFATVSGRERGGPSVAEAIEQRRGRGEGGVARVELIEVDAQVSDRGLGQRGAGNWCRMGVEPEGFVVLTGVAALDAEAAVRTGGWGPALSRTGTKEQDARGAGAGAGGASEAADGPERSG